MPTVSPTGRHFLCQFLKSLYISNILWLNGSSYCRCIVQRRYRRRASPTRGRYAEFNRSAFFMPIPQNLLLINTIIK